MEELFIVETKNSKELFNLLKDNKTHNLLGKLAGLSYEPYSEDLKGSNGLKIYYVRKHNGNRKHVKKVR